MCQDALKGRIYTSTALSASPLFSARAFLQSIMPAPVLSRRALTVAAEIPAYRSAEGEF